ncbi:hypothetical protein QTL95_21335 [Rhizobium sp. S152]|uniref:hypothetical protein n=1 Tax=Rhizobium sp. S152 TaxID=3055038 RepID=UPI0025A97E81|nr:hypothetical protein [Rhizobium sp. S152]MDM9628443.1 hypothetical protein [Rhizobium sp. S152]
MRYTQPDSLGCCQSATNRVGSDGSQATARKKVYLGCSLRLMSSFIAMPYRHPHAELEREFAKRVPHENPNSTEIEHDSQSATDFPMVFVGRACDAIQARTAADRLVSTDKFPAALAAA